MAKMMKTKPKQSQYDKFREAARELGTDDSEERFNERLKRISKLPPPDDDDKSDKEKPPNRRAFC